VEGSASTSEELTLLAVTSEPPWPLNSGGHLRTYHLLRNLARVFRVTLVSATAGAVVVPELDHADIETDFVRVPERALPGEALRALRSAIRSRPYVLFDRHNRAEVRRRLKQKVALTAPDILYLDHLDSFVFADTAPGAVIVADLHNVYSVLASRTAAEAHGPLRAYLRREARLLAQMEARCAVAADAIFTVSEADQRYYADNGGRTHLVPNGVECNQYADLPVGRHQGALILYIGDMSWPPNVSAAKFLAELVLADLQRHVPDAALRIVGRNPTAEVRALAQRPGVTVTGAVDDVKPHLLDARVLAVPLETGGGTRLKILEAFAAGLPVVSSRVGAEGIAYVDGEHLVLAERPQFAAALAYVLRDAVTSTRMATAARQLARRVYDWSVVADTAIAAITDACHHRTHAPV